MSGNVSLQICHITEGLVADLADEIFCARVLDCMPRQFRPLIKLLPASFVFANELLGFVNHQVLSQYLAVVDLLLASWKETAEFRRASDHELFVRTPNMLGAVLSSIGGSMEGQFAISAWELALIVFL